MKHIAYILFLVLPFFGLGQGKTFVVKKDIIVYDTTFNDYRIEVVFSDTSYQAKKEYQNSFRVNVYFKEKLIPDSTLSYNYICECDWKENIPSDRKIVVRKSSNNENKLIWGSQRRSIIMIEDVKHKENMILEKHIFFPINVTELK